VTALLLLLVVALAALAALVVVVFLLGSSSQTELTRVHLEAAQAERQLHDLARQALAEMFGRAEHHARHGPDQS
jgi:hypothetical protein